MRAAILASLAAMSAAELATTLRIRSTSTTAGVLQLVELMAIDSTGKIVTDGVIPTASGGAVASGTTLASCTDLNTDAYINSVPGVTAPYLRYTFAAGATAVINITFPVADVSRIVVVTRAATSSTWSTTSRELYAALPVIELLNNGVATFSTGIGSATDTALVQVITPPGANTIVLPDALFPATQTSDELASGYRYLFITPPSSFVYIREVLVSLTSGHIVSFSRGAGTGSAVPGLAGGAAFPTDLVINTQGTGLYATVGNTTTGSNTWFNSVGGTGNGLRIDFGAAFPNIKRINVLYYACIGCGDSAITRSNGARIRLYNGNNAVAADWTGPSLGTYGPFSGSYSLDQIISPTPTPSSTPTTTSTATGSPTPTASPTQTGTPTPTGTLPVGAEPSQTSTESSTSSLSATASSTGSLTASRSITGTVTGTASITPSNSPTPSGTPMPASALRVVTTLPAGFLALVEVMAFDVRGQLLTVSSEASPFTSGVAAALSSASSVIGANALAFVNDLGADTFYSPRWYQGAPPTVNASQTVTITFSRPAHVARVHFFLKKGTTSFAAQWAASGATAQLLAPDGATIVGSRLVNGTGYVQTWTVQAYQAPVPVPAAAVAAGAPDSGVTDRARFITINCAYSLLSVRELMAFDFDGVNVALRKTVATNRGTIASASLGVDGGLDNDVDPEASTFVSSACSVSSGPANAAFWTVDLGGAFALSKLVFAQRLNSDGILANTYTRNTGAAISVLNPAGEVIWSSSILSANGTIQTFDLGSAFAPATPSATASASTTASVTASPSSTATGSLTVGALASPTNTPTASVTPSNTPSSSATPTQTPSGTRAPLLTTPVYAVRIVGNSSRFPLSVVELQVFSSSGKLLSGTGICAPSCQDGFPASAANDNDVDPVSSTYALTSVGTDATPASFTFTLDSPAIVSRVVFVQRKGSFAGNTYTIPAATNFAPNALRLNARVELIMEAGSVLDFRPANRNANLQTVLFAPPLAVPVYPVGAQSPADARRFVRFIRMHCWFSLLAIRELQVFTEDGTNVALGKTAWSNYYTAASPARFAPSNAVDGIMEGDDINSANETAMFLSNACPSPLGSGASVAFWQLDLGASYDVKRIIFFNRMPATGSTGDYTRNAGAPLVLLNGFNDTLLGAAINGVTPSAEVNQFVPGAAFNVPSANFVHTFNVDLSSIAVPSASATPTNTPSVSATLTPNYVPPSETPTVSGTAAVTPSTTATGTATTSFGSSSSQTGTTSATASITATPSGTPPPTPSASATPGVASGLRVTISGGVCLSFFEVIAVSPTGQILTVGATASATSVLNNDVDSFGPQNAIDLQMTDPTASGVTLTQAGTNSRPFSSGCGLSDSVTITFAPAFAGSVVDKVFFVNDASSPTVASRVVTGNAQVQLLNNAGMPYASQPLTSATLTTLSFYSGPAQVPVPPPVSDSDSLLASLVRYVRIVGPNPATGGVALRLREVWAIDGSGVIVSAAKPVTTSPFVAASFPQNLTNGVIDFDAGSAGDLASSDATDRFIPRFGPGYGCASDTNCNNTNWMQIDLGGMFNVTQLLIWNRAGPTFQTQIAGGSTFLINAYGQVVGAATGRALTTAPIQSLSYSLFAPSSTPTTTASSTSTRSNTPSASTTRSGTPTPSSTRSATASPSNTPSTSVTATVTRTATQTPTTSRTGTAAATGTGTGTSAATTTRTPTGSGSSTRSQTPSLTSSATGSVSATASETASVSATQTGTPSASQTETGTPSTSGTQTGTPSASGTQTGTPSPSQTGTASQTPSLSSTGTAASTGTGTPASTGTGTPAATGTATKTRIALPSATPTRTRTRTGTASRTKTKTRTRTRTPSKKKKLMA